MSVTRKVGALFGALVVAVVVAACGSGMGGGGTGSGGGGGGGDGGGGSGNHNGGASSSASPKILSLQTNISSMTSSDMLVISAVVTDPDGIDDVIGGNLETPDGIAAYGAFATDASEGAYSITLTWDSLNTVAPIVTDAGGSVSRTMRATFFDVEGNTVWRDVSISLGCGGATRAACDGRCEDLTSTQSCGACDSACSSGLQCIVDGGAARGCGRQYSWPEPAPCSALCQQAVMLTCVAGVATYADHSQVDFGCDNAPDSSNGGQAFVSESCTCVH